MPAGGGKGRDGGAVVEGGPAPGATGAAPVGGMAKGKGGAPGAPGGGGAPGVPGRGMPGAECD